MSNYKELTIWKPLPEGHPLIGRLCFYCLHPVSAGEVLTYVDRFPADSAPAHLRCATKEPFITCPQCGRTSFNQNNIKFGYCGDCHAWTAKPAKVQQGMFSE